ncbi:MAG: PilZ domain-containing protein [Planctomycetes bacterium]|nr:PilZ domain-containing protein [Planctomycetota bacterium]
MPKCMQCGLDVIKKADLTLVKNGEGKWVLFCHRCASADQDLNPAAVAGEHPKINLPDSPMENETRAHNRATIDSPESASDLLEMDTNEAEAAFDRIRKVLESVNESNEVVAVTHAHNREHERKDADLNVAFCLLRDDQAHLGKIKDISQGGLRFQTHIPLKKKQIITLKVQALGENEEGIVSKQTLLNATGEVRRVSRLDEDFYEVGVKFVSRARSNEKNRRKHKRINVSMTAYYKRDGSEYTSRAEVLDISQSGARIMTDEEISKGERFGAFLRSDDGSFALSDLVCTLECVRIIQIRHGEWELGCKFTQIKAKPRSKA